MQNSVLMGKKSWPSAPAQIHAVSKRKRPHAIGVNHPEVVRVLKSLRNYSRVVSLPSEAFGFGTSVAKDNGHVKIIQKLT